MPLKSAASKFLEQASQKHHWDKSFQAKENRLTVVSQYFPPDFAATGQLLDDLTGRLAQRGLQVQVLSGMPAYAYNQAEAEAVEFKPNRVIFRSRASRLWPRRIRGRAVNGLLFCLRTSLRLLKYARRGDLLVYTTEPPYLPIFGWLIYRLTGTPYALILYDLYPDVLVELNILSERHWFARFWRQLNRYAYRDASELVVLSQAMRSRLEFFTPEISDKISVIPSWADINAIQPIPKSKNWFVKRYGLEKSFNVLYSGNQGRCHDLVTMMAAALVLRDKPEIRFVFIGSGPQQKRIKDLAIDWGLNNCLFLPYQDYEVLPSSLCCADLAVVSLAITAVGLVAPSKLYGHLAAGTPLAVITPPDSDLRNLVEGKLGGWFANGAAVELADYIQELMQNPNKLALLGKQCRLLAEKEYSGEVVANQYYKLIQSVISPADKQIKQQKTLSNV